jgi:antitoxin VapB
MIEVESKTFKSGNSEAVRLPKEVAYGAGVEVTIRKVGNRITIEPKQGAKKTMADLVARLREIGPPPGPKFRRQRIVPPKREGG